MRQGCRGPGCPEKNPASSFATWSYRLSDSPPCPLQPGTANFMMLFGNLSSNVNKHSFPPVMPWLCATQESDGTTQQQCRLTLFCALSTASPNANTRLCWSRQYPSDWVRRLRLVICSITAMPCQMPTQLLLAVLDRMPLSSTPQSYEARLSQRTSVYHIVAPPTGPARMNHAVGRRKIISPASCLVFRRRALLETGYSDWSPFSSSGINCPSLIYTAIGGNCWPARCSQTGELVTS